MKKTVLFCFPYAGGSSGVYVKWKKYLHRSIELIPVELAGRGRRIYDPLYQNVEEAIDDVLKITKNHILHSRYALFGHSLGALIAYELAHRIREIGLPMPQHVFFSGRGAPQVPRKKDRPVFHKLPDDEFKKEILKLGGTPKEFFEHPELLEVLLPTLRGDFRMSETYRDQHDRDGKVDPLAYDISVFMGKDEEITAEQMFGWREQSKKMCSMYYFEGEHFFIHEHTEELVKIINHTLVSE